MLKPRGLYRALSDATPAHDFTPAYDSPGVTTAMIVNGSETCLGSGRHDRNGCIVTLVCDGAELSSFRVGNIVSFDVVHPFLTRFFDLGTYKIKLGDEEGLTMCPYNAT